MYLPNIGAKLKQLRSQRKLTQSDLGNLLGVSKSVISSYENNIHYPPYDVLLQLARIFGVTTDYLLNAESHRIISLDGLTNAQMEAITSIVNELRALKDSE